MTPNFLTSLQKGRDARRKADLHAVQSALELYYEDKKAYPSADSLVLIYDGNPHSLIDSASGKIYMKLLPNDPLATNNYVYCVNATNSQYQLYALLDNTQDPQIISPTQLVSCSTPTTCRTSTNCNYGIASSDTLP
ncbi:type II secretion system protein GspG [Candidatus Roizmanbacteria bacterium]|nr:type II secretion system protein GspG [Candidatus Roizmanbacteria bacterium]